MGNKIKIEKIKDDTIKDFFLIQKKVLREKLPQGNKEEIITTI